METLFKKLDAISLYDKSQEEEMLTDLKEINIFITQNKLYIPKKLQSTANNILDYFKNILTDFRQKSIEREYVQFETKIELLDAADNVLKYFTSTAFFETKSLDASHDFMYKIYKKAIRTSIYKCFEQLNE